MAPRLLGHMDQLKTQKKMMRMMKKCPRNIMADGFGYASWRRDVTLILKVLLQRYCCCCYPCLWCYFFRFVCVFLFSGRGFLCLLHSSYLLGWNSHKIAKKASLIKILLRLRIAIKPKSKIIHKTQCCCCILSPENGNEMQARLKIFIKMLFYMIFALSPCGTISFYNDTDDGWWSNQPSMLLVDE